MIQFPQTVDRPSQEITDNFSRIGLQIAFVLFLLVCTFVCLSFIFPVQLPGKSDSLEAILIFLATLTTLFSLSRQLPAQNVLLASAVIGFLGSTIHLIGSMTQIPFGPFMYAEDFGPRFYHKLPWAIPFIWVLVVLNSRGVARLILRPWRKTRNYGWWVIGLTVVLGVLLDLGWETFAFRVKHFMYWRETKFFITWNGTPLVNYLGWILTLLLVLAFSTPMLINKKRSRSKSVPDYYPLGVWVLFNVLFLTGAAVNQLWPAVILAAISSVLVTAFALRGARW